MRDNQGVLMGLETTGNIRGFVFYHTFNECLKKYKFHFRKYREIGETKRSIF